MDKIVHLALGTPHVAKTANFYKEVFGLYEVRRTYEPGSGDNPPDEMLRRIFLSDGYAYLAICHDRVAQFYHFGFDVENMDETLNRLRASGAPLISDSPGRPGRHNEFKCKDPDGVIIDLSQGGWVLKPAR